MNDFYTTRRKSKRRDTVILLYVLGTIRVNWKTLFSIKQKLDIKKEDTFSITYKLAKSLVYPFIAELSLNRLCTKTIQKIDFILSREPEKVATDLDTNNYPNLGDNRRRSYKCIEQFQSKKEKKWWQKIGKKVCLAKKLLATSIVQSLAIAAYNQESLEIHKFITWTNTLTENGKFKFLIVFISLIVLMAFVCSLLDFRVQSSNFRVCYDLLILCCYRFCIEKH